MKESAMTPQRPDETTLHAWVDGELQPDAAAAVAQWLAEHPEEAARMAAIQAQNAGLQALHVQLLDEPARRAVLRQEADVRGVFLSDDVMDYMLRRFSRDLGSLMQLLDMLDGFALRNKRAITIPLLKTMLETE